MDPIMEAHRNRFIQDKAAAQADFDKHVLSLSGGGLGISIVFINSIIGNNPINDIWFLLVAWFCWIGSIAFTMISFLFAGQAADISIKQVDDGTVGKVPIGGVWNSLTKWANYLSGSSFLIGLLCMMYFISQNLRSTHV
jgi:hypothetical protein